MVQFVILEERDFKKGGRRKGGADPDQAPVVETTLEIDSPGEVLNELPAGVNKASLKSVVIETIRLGSVAIHKALTSEAAKNLAILGVVAGASAGALNMADSFYGSDVCSPAMEQLAESMATFGITGSKLKCVAAMEAYKSTFALLKPAVYLALSSATGRLIGIKINIGEGFLAQAMNAMISKLQATPDASPAEGAPAPAPKGKKGGRTKRHGMKKGRKGGKSRKHRR
jgi:hypothetical protein